MFSEVGGMEELNSHKPIKVKNCKVRGAGLPPCRCHAHDPGAAPSPASFAARGALSVCGDSWVWACVSMCSQPFSWPTCS